MKRAILLYICLLATITGFCQDALFSQYYAAPLFMNPALTSVEQSTYVGINHRTQWASLDNPYQTSQVSLILPVFQKYAERVHVGGVGLTVYQDDLGGLEKFKSTGVLISGAYNVRLSEFNSLSLGIQGGLVQKSIDRSRLRWGSQYNEFIGYDEGLEPSFGDINDRKTYPSINIGVLYFMNHDKRYYAKRYSGFFGLSVAHLNRPNESLIQNSTNSKPTLFKAHGALEFEIGRGLQLSPTFLFMAQSHEIQTNIGTYLTYQFHDLVYNKNYTIQSIMLGAWHRIDDSFIFGIGLGGKSINIGFSYDLTTSDFNKYNNGQGAYEVSITYRRKNKNLSKRYSTPLI